MKHDVSNTNAIGSTKHNCEEPHRGKYANQGPFALPWERQLCATKEPYFNDHITVAKKIAMLLLKINHNIFCCMQRKVAALCRTYKQHNQARYMCQ